eukprot:scaffold3396_cov268-Ochromonas_danica.AAC.13
MEGLKKDIEILSRNVDERDDVDRKDASLQTIDRDLEEAEEQYQMALRTHRTNIENLLKLHNSRLYALERNFQKELQILQTEFAQDKEVILAKFTREKRELAAIIEAVEQEEEEEGRNSEIEELEEHFETSHWNYLSQTAQRTHDFQNSNTFRSETIY